MSLPEFPTPDPCLTREQAINMILVSIAMEEMALSHIMEAESEKIKYVLDYQSNPDCCACIGQILEINESVSKLIETIMETQIILKKKMESALNALPKPCLFPCPPRPVAKPEQCFCALCQHHKHSAVFSAKPFRWYHGGALSLRRQPSCCTGIALPPSRDTEILLLDCGRFIVNFNIELMPLTASLTPVSLELQHTCPSKTISTERFHASCERNCVTVSGSTIIETPRNCPHSYLCIKLLSPCGIQVKSGRISVVEL